LAIRSQTARADEIGRYRFAIHNDGARMHDCPKAMGILAVGSVASPSDAWRGFDAFEGRCLHLAALR
jgi:hypothetical protein